ncbi:MAG: hypothetical protein KC416_16820, partial [Myxococcales bacterium]|nr:hypothetical protein [Myxococcales bacterium]
ETTEEGRSEEADPADPADPQVPPAVDVSSTAITAEQPVGEGPVVVEREVDIVTEEAVAVDAPEGAYASRSVLAEDVEPTASLFSSDDFALSLGGLTQVHFAPLVGEDALLANGDAASEAGFRIRRARVGFEGALGDDFGIYLGLNLIGVDSADGVVSDAKIAWSPAKELLLSVGSGKVAYSRAALESSRRLPLVERAYAVNAITPGRRLGVTAEGAVWEDRIAYLVGVMNGTRGFALGNQFGGVLYAGRLEFNVWGHPDSRDPWADGIALGGGALYDNGPSAATLAWSGDLVLAYEGARLVGEVLCDTTDPDDTPAPAATVADTVDRCGGYVELAYTLPVWKAHKIQPAVRGELFDDNTALDDAGDLIAIGGGINGYLIDPYVRLQLHYLARIEREGVERKNDTLVMVVQGTF